MYLVEASLIAPRGLEAFVKDRIEADEATELELAVLAGIVSVGEYLRRLVDHSRGHGLPEGWVPQTTFWLVDKYGMVVGVGHLRHGLTPILLMRGGHIDYYVKAAERRKGYGDAILKQILSAARALQIDKVLLTAATANQASIKVIEHNGGILENELPDHSTGEPYRRYWIEVPR